MDKSKIKILITGGTIDDLEYEKEEDAPQNHQSLTPNLLKQSRITAEYDVEVLMQKDSRFITNEDRKIILEKCKSCTEEKIIVTHGTATMPETAKFLGRANIGKTIVLFGSAIPANKENSDTLYNLGSAFIAVQLLSAGVYIVMNGKVFAWDNVKKNFFTGYFEEANGRNSG